MEEQVEDDFEPFLKGPPLPVADRYYYKHFALDVKGRVNEDHCVLQHTNRVCVVCLAPTHPLLQERDVHINKVEFQIGKLDRTSNAVSGRFKNDYYKLCLIQGGQKLTPSSPLCFVHCKNGQNCIKGILLEVNEALIKTPQLLVTKPLSEGYIAILIPKHTESNTVCSDLLDELQYKTIRT